jgi:two-component system invasion response regulator UvrY
LIRALVVDDHRIVMRGIEQILLRTPDIRVTGDAASGREAIERAGSEEFDIVLLDISLPDRNGLDVLKILKERKPRLPVLILSMHPEEQYALRALKAGASGYLTKESAQEELIEAIRRISRGRKYVSASLAERLAMELSPGSEGPPHERLSDREYQVMLLIGAGKKINDIAAALFLSPKTITTYKSRVLQKMGMEGTADVVRYLVEHGITG